VTAADRLLQQEQAHVVSDDDDLYQMQLQAALEESLRDMHTPPSSSATAARGPAVAGADEWSSGDNGDVDNDMWYSPPGASNARRAEIRRERLRFEYGMAAAEESKESVDGARGGGGGPSGYSSNGRAVRPPPPVNSLRLRDVVGGWAGARRRQSNRLPRHELQAIARERKETPEERSAMEAVTGEKPASRDALKKRVETLKRRKEKRAREVAEAEEQGEQPPKRRRRTPSVRRTMAVAAAREKRKQLQTLQRLFNEERELFKPPLNLDDLNWDLLVDLHAHASIAHTVMGATGRQVFIPRGANNINMGRFHNLTKALMAMYDKIPARYADECCTRWSEMYLDTRSRPSKAHASRNRGRK